MEGQVFPFRRRRQKRLRVVLLFGRDFLSPHTTKVSGIETIPAPVGLSPMSCFSDDLAQLLPCLDRVKVALHHTYITLPQVTLHTAATSDQAQAI